MPKPASSVDVRDRLTEALRLDLVGPESGPEYAEERLPIPPSRWYLTGFLVPYEAKEEHRTDDTAIDASCLDPAYAAAHNAVGVHPEICYDTTYTLLNHITTPFFARQDINDPLGREKYMQWLLYPSGQAFTAAQAAQLVDTATLAGGLEPIAVTPGVSGTHCQQHVTVLTGDFFSDTPVFPAGGPVGLSFHDLLWNWLNAAGPARQVQPDGIAGPPYTPSNC